MDGNHKIRRARCISNISCKPITKLKKNTTEYFMVRRSKRILEMKNIQSTKRLNSFNKNTTAKKQKSCNADLVINTDFGCDETPHFGSYFCKKHLKQDIPENNSYDGKILRFNLRESN